MSLTPTAKYELGRKYGWWWLAPPPSPDGKDGHLKDASRLKRYYKYSFWCVPPAHTRWDRKHKPHYRFGVPFPELNRKQRESCKTLYPQEPEDLAPILIRDLDDTKELTGRKGYIGMIYIDVENYPVGALMRAFRDELPFAAMRAGIPFPKFKTDRRNRILNAGRSFKPIEALDVLRFSNDSVLKNSFRRDHSRAMRQQELLRQFTRCGNPPGTEQNT